MPHPPRPALSLVLAFLPACALVGGLPFVNRLEPVLLGLPFLLLWILGWVVVTPLFLFMAYRAQGHPNDEATTRETSSGLNRRSTGRGDGEAR